MKLRAAALAAMLALTGCDKLAPARSPFQSIDVTGTAIGDELRLRDHNETERTLADFRASGV